MTSQNTSASEKTVNRQTLCLGDIHGQITSLNNLPAAIHATLCGANPQVSPL
jgi:hypothetical protein